MPFDDLRAYLRRLEEEGELVNITQEVDWNEEVGAIVRRTDELGLPAVMFDNIKDYPNRRIAAEVGVAGGPSRLSYCNRSLRQIDSCTSGHTDNRLTITAKACYGVLCIYVVGCYGRHGNWRSDSMGRRDRGPIPGVRRGFLWCRSGHLAAILFQALFRPTNLVGTVLAGDSRGRRGQRTGAMVIQRGQQANEASA